MIYLSWVGYIQDDWSEGCNCKTSKKLLHPLRIDRNMEEGNWKREKISPYFCPQGAFYSIIHSLDWGWRFSKLLTSSTSIFLNCSKKWLSIKMKNHSVVPEIVHNIYNISQQRASSCRFKINEVVYLNFKLWVTYLYTVYRKAGSTMNSPWVHYLRRFAHPRGNNVLQQTMVGKIVGALILMRSLQCRMRWRHYCLLL